jgi:RNA polymerase sigma factor (sigma-70 family)
VVGGVSLSRLLSQVRRERQLVRMTQGWDEDAMLVARIARAEQAAFAAIYDRYLPLVLRWSLRETGNRELAADLAAETFAAALIASPRYRPGRGSVGAWLLGIARNKLRESRRRRRVEDSARRRVGLETTTFSESDFERVEELISLDRGVIELLDTLPPALREAVSLHVIEERSYEEIADQLRCSESVVRQRVSRGLRAMRSELEER